MWMIYDIRTNRPASVARFFTEDQALAFLTRARLRIRGGERLDLLETIFYLGIREG